MERSSHRSILIEPEGITVFASTMSSFVGWVGAHRDWHSIDSIRNVSVHPVNTRGSAWPVIVFDLHEGSTLAVGLRSDQTPSELRERLREWGYAWT